MGVVYRAHDAALGRDIALKLLPDDAAMEPAARQRLIREARSAAALNHPSICTIHEVGEGAGPAYIAMEFIEGESLDRLIARGRLGLEQVLDYGIQMADAVAHAHESGIVHRDLKTSNTLLTPTGRVKVLDFGLAKPLPSDAIRDATTRLETSLTGEGAIVGTLPYMAPERFHGKEADARTDVWALGVVLYEMAAGRRPFQASTSYELAAAIVNERPADLPASVPAELGVIVDRCLQKEPARRYRHAGELHAALDAIRTGTAATGALWRYRLNRRRNLALAGAALVALLSVLAVLDAGGIRSWAARMLAPSAASMKLAVLPVQDLTGDQDQDYFADGLTDELISQLGRLHPSRLGVLARTSMMSYRDSGKPVDQIGAELDADYVLEATARREGSRIRFSARLIAVSDQTQRWSDIFEGEMTSILAIQNELARGVAEALALTLLPEEERRLAQAREVDPRAYEAYLKGSQHLRGLTPADLDVAMQYFESALAIDPEYAPAYSGISNVWGSRQQMGYVPALEASPKASEAARAAVAIDDDLAEAHLSLASRAAWGDWDWRTAETEFLRAIELNPNLADARAIYSHLLSILGRSPEALSQATRALELDPLSAFVRAFYGGDLLFARRFDDAASEFRTALEVAPDLPFATNGLGRALYHMGSRGEALRLWAGQLTSEVPEVEERVLGVYSQDGFAAAMLLLAEAHAESYRLTGTRAVRTARSYLMAGDSDRAIEWLERAYVDRDPNLPYLLAPDYDDLRGDPRFADLLARMNLPR